MKKSGNEITSTNIKRLKNAEDSMTMKNTVNCEVNIPFSFTEMLKKSPVIKSETGLFRWRMDCSIILGRPEEAVMHRFKRELKGIFLILGRCVD